MTEAEREAALAQLLAIVRGEGIYRHLGAGLRSWKFADDGKYRRLHECLVELEGRGLVVRAAEDETHVIWRPADGG